VSRKKKSEPKIRFRRKKKSMVDNFKKDMQCMTINNSKEFIDNNSSKTKAS